MAVSSLFAQNLDPVDANNSGLYPVGGVPFQEYVIPGLSSGATKVEVAAAAGSPLDPYLQVFKQELSGDLTPVGDSYDFNLSTNNTNATVNFSAEAGVTYLARIVRSGTDAGQFDLQVENAAVVAPALTAAGAADLNFGDLTPGSLAFPAAPLPPEAAPPNPIPEGPSIATDDLSGLNLFYLTDASETANLGVRVETQGFFVAALNGDDRIIGTADADYMNGNKGNDTLEGGAGVDQMRGGRDSDLLDGGDGNEIILNGNNGNDSVRGGLGDDTVNGGKNDDLLFGEIGNDELSGDFGQDILTGGAGADTFVLRADANLTEGLSNAAAAINGADILTDFAIGADEIKLNASDGLTFADLQFELAAIDFTNAVPDVTNPGTDLIPAGVATGTAIKVVDAGSPVNGQYLGVVLNVLPGDLNDSANFTVA